MGGKTEYCVRNIGEESSSRNQATITQFEVRKEHRSFQDKRSISYREASEGEDLSVHQQHGRVVAARCHLDTGTWQSLHECGGAPRDREGRHLLQQGCDWHH